MRKPTKDSFPAVIGGCVILLALFFHSIYEDLLKAAVLNRLSAVMGVPEAELVSGLTEMSLPILGSVAVVWFLYGYLKRELSAQDPDPAIEAQRQHTAAIHAQTEAIRATVWAAEPVTVANAEDGGGLEENEKPLPIPINEASLGAYMWSSPRVKRLDRQIAEVAGLGIEPEHPMAFPMVEQALLLGVADLVELDGLLDHYQEEVVKLSSYSRPSKVVTKGECVWYLFNFLSAQLGKEKFEEFIRLLANSTGSGAGMLTGFEQITKYSPKGLRPVTWWKPATDFNLMPLMEAVELAQTELKDTNDGKARGARSAPSDALALSYCYTFTSMINLYGRRIEYDRRVTPSDFRRAITNPIHSKIVIDGGLPKLVPRLKFYDSNMQRPIWDRLCVLRLQVAEAIEILKNKP
jgi:hypothetical protein